MFGCGFMELSGMDSLHSSYEIFQLSPYEREGERGPTPSQQPAKGPKLCADVSLGSQLEYTWPCL